MVTFEQPPTTARRPIRSALDEWRGSAESLIAEVAATKYDVRPFDPGTMDLCAALSGRLMQLRVHPEAVALGFWMRPAALARMRAEFEASIPRNQLAVPRGLAFHITPANVDTLFVYSWVLSLLVGNANIVRLSSRSTEVRTRILEAVAAVLEEPAMADLARRNYFVLTDHDETALRGFSAASDVRVVWGGDATVDHFRRFPIPVRGRDVVFPDRHSLAILDAASIAALDEAGLGSLADHFFDDAFWFDQGACSSPRLLLWRAADDPDYTERAVQRFRDAVLAATRRRHYKVETGMALNKMAFATDVAARVEGVRIESVANEATWVRLVSVADYDRESCGGGLFFEVMSHDLAADLSTLVGPRDQTVTTFGVDREELLALAGRINGRGVDRFVPVGRALAFDSTWDGSDLLIEFSRRVVIDAGPPSRSSSSSPS
jgi:Acyl-CoA reductase (LuxC)